MIDFNVDITLGSFSRRGSYQNVKNQDKPDNNGNPAGLYVRSLHGVSQAQRSIFRLVPMLDGKECEPQIESLPWKLTLKEGGASLEIVFADDHRMLIRSRGMGLELRSCLPHAGAYLARTFVRYSENQWRYLDTVSHTNYLLTCTAEIACENDWNGHNATTGRFIMAAGDWELELDDILTSRKPAGDDRSFDQAAADVEADFRDYLAHMLPCPERFDALFVQAAYINWSALVKPAGHMKHESMFMSNNNMVHIWSWDHCFNAMALKNLPTLAYDQLAGMFDLQDERGCIPDYMDDYNFCWDFCKPPIHGWTLMNLMKNGAITMEMAEDFYPKLSAWTRWWLNDRDSDGDGICEYYHGNDSGWDNSTLFLGQPPLELPDLSAFLVLQMDALSRLAEYIGKKYEAESWKRESDALLERMIGHFVRGDRMISVESGSHREINERSLQSYLPLLLGDRLPGNVREAMVASLKESGLITKWGMATEPPTSKYYHPDGYWRGPIWAPSTYIMFDALLRCGEVDFARHVADRFCAMCMENGFPENYDALTGEGRRDRSYTWTASVFQLLAGWLSENE